MGINKIGHKKIIESCKTKLAQQDKFVRVVADTNVENAEISFVDLMPSKQSTEAVVSPQQASTSASCGRKRPYRVLEVYRNFVNGIFDFQLLIIKRNINVKLIALTNNSWLSAYFLWIILKDTDIVQVLKSNDIDFYNHLNTNKDHLPGEIMTLIKYVVDDLIEHCGK